VPTYHFSCTKHKPLIEVTRISVKPMNGLSAEELEKLARCPIEDESYGRHAMKRTPRPPTVTVKESLDNGVMTHRLERFKDAEQLYRDRAAADPEKK
jgi:hypothetical protein